MFKKNNTFGKISLEFSFFSITENISLSNLNLSNKFLYSKYTKNSCKGGLLDNKLGWSEQKPCEICKKDLKKCPGHFGYIKFYLPVFNIGYLKSLQTILQIVCKNCSRILIKPYGFQIEILNYFSENSKVGYIKKVIRYSKTNKICHYCNCKNGIIKKIGNFNFIHDVSFRIDFSKIKKSAEQTSKFKRKAILDLLNPLKIFRILQKVKTKDLEFLEMNQVDSRPENLILHYIPVPPLAIRPSIFLTEKTSNEDDLTIKLSEIQEINLQIKSLLSSGASFDLLIERWNTLQIETARYLNSEIFPRESGFKTNKGLYQRLKGKNGRFRGNLSGKRVDFSARTVISPSPDLNLNSIGMPLRIAMELTFPERISKINFERLKRSVDRGPEKYPGANFIIDLNGKKTTIKVQDEVINQMYLREGFKIERHIKNSDIILFNRQPSLHKVSIMAHRVTIVRSKTFKLNSCVCKPYNADFDGDEMNVHVPQTQKGRAEALLLMNLALNIITSRGGELCVAPSQDLLSCSFMITSKSQFFSSKDFLDFIPDKFEKTFFTPVVLKPICLWTGKQIFSQIMHLNCEFFFGKFYQNNFLQKKINIFQVFEKNYSLKEKQCSPYGCPYDGWVLFKKGKLLSGCIGKNVIGSSTKSSFFCVLTNLCSFRFIIELMLTQSRIFSNWISQEGFSIGLDDITFFKFKLFCKKKEKIFHVYNLCQFINRMLNKKKSLRVVYKILDFLREDVGKKCMNINIFKNNAALIMVASGSKGSTVNLCQMISCLGQQSTNKIQTDCGVLGRILPSSKYNYCKFIPQDNGFVKNSFYRGLNSKNYFLHAVAGREGLIDTAVKTSETGYLQRRLVKFLEDIVCFYDLSIRTSDGRLIRFKLGVDGIDSTKNSWFYDISEFSGNIMKLTTFSRTKILIFFEVETFSKAFCSYDLESSPLLSEFKSLFCFFYLSTYFKLTADFIKMELIFKKISKILISSNIDPGTPVGASAGQNIGEPGTQLTLQTFHSAGIISLNFSSGISRINEILNASKVINFPIIKIIPIKLVNKYYIFKIRKILKKTEIIDCCRSAEIKFKYIQLKCKIYLNFHLRLNLGELIILIKKNQNLGLDCKIILKKTKKLLSIFFYNLIFRSKDEKYGTIDFLKNNFFNLITEGYFEIEQITNQIENHEFHFFINSCHLKDVLNFYFIDKKRIYCNHSICVFKIFGIEAARITITVEIKSIFQTHGITVDVKHIDLLSDAMTFQGKILGITRYGLTGMKSNTLVLASFEKTIENLFYSAVKMIKDEALGVSESIILGREVPIGTGLVSIGNF